ncbi:uncharacterized protein LOC144450372 [Glandiceps talaboti]
MGKVEEREKRLRTTIKDVLYCDVHQTNPVAPQTLPPFDCVTSAYCLKSTCRTKEQWIQALRNVGCLLKNGGTLVQLALPLRYYIVDGKKYDGFAADKDFFKSAMVDAGFTNIDIQFMNNSVDTSTEIDYDFAFFAKATKNEKTRPPVPSWGKGSSANSNSNGRTPSPSPGCSRSMPPLPPSFGKERANSNKEVTNSTSNICNGRSPPPTPGSSRSLSPLPPRTLDMDERLNDGFGQDQYPTDSTERTLKTVLLVLSEIRQQVKQNTLLLKSLKVRQQQQVNVDIDISEDFRLPMESEADVTAVEETLQDKEKSKRLVRHLSTLGGVSSKDVVERIMVAMFSQSLSTIYNWLGKGKLKKHALSQLSIATIIKDAAKQSNVKEADCEAAIKNWLKYASDRDGGRKKRAEKQKERDREQARKFKALNLNLDSSDDEQE